MRLAVFDTNVIVSAGISPDGAPARLIMEWVFEGLVQAVTSPAVVEEYRLVVRRPKFTRYGFPPQWLEFMIDESLHLPDAAFAWTALAPDQTDLRFLALSRSSGAWLITGNLKHYPQAIREGVKVVSPADYLSGLEET